MGENLTSLDPSTLSNIPLLSPPAGVTPNFANPASNIQPFLIVTSVSLGIMLMFVVNRTYVKTFLIRKYSWDDLTLLLAVFSSVAYYVACVWGAQRGKMGVHEWDISILEAMSREILIPVYLSSVLILPTLLFTKITFFIMYLQIFYPRRWMRICSYLGIFVIAGFYSGIAIYSFYIETPRRGETWFSHQTPALQHEGRSLFMHQSYVGLATDIYILVLPIVAVSELQMPIRRKIGVMLIFMTGLLACIASLLSIYYRNVLLHTTDLTWNLMPVNTLSLVEMFVGITCACMPHAAHTCRHHLASLDKIRKKIGSQSSALASTFRKSSKTSLSSQEKQSYPNNSLSNNKPYFALDSDSNLGRSHLIPTNSVRTKIEGGRNTQDDVERNAICVRYEMQNEI